MSASPVRPGHSVRTVFNWPPPASIARAAGWTNRFLPGHQSDCADRREPAAATGISPYAASPVSRTTAGDAWEGGVHVTRNHEHPRSEEHTSELQSLMRISYPVLLLKKKNDKSNNYTTIK